MSDVRTLSRVPSADGEPVAETTVPQVEAGPARCIHCGHDLEHGPCPYCGGVSRVGGYRVLRLLAQTDHSRMYLAQDEAGHPVALKELLFAQVPGPEQIEAFEREATVLRRLDHPQIPKFLASFSEGTGIGTRLYLAQEYVAGETLAERLAHHRFSEHEARDIAAQVLGILTYLHGLSPKLLHRDIKPENLIVRADGSIALVDFGTARDLTKRVTYRSTLVGTFGYMPWEQLGGTVSESSDLYSLGMTLAHLLTGKPPEELLGPSMEVRLEGQLAVSPEFLAFLQRLTAHDQRDRYATAIDAKAALEGPPATPRMAEAPVPTSLAPPSEPRMLTVEPSQTMRRWALIFLGLATGVLAVAAILGFVNTGAVMCWAVAGAMCARAWRSGVRIEGDVVKARGQTIPLADIDEVVVKGPRFPAHMVGRYHGRWYSLHVTRKSDPSAKLVRLASRLSQDTAAKLSRTLEHRVREISAKGERAG